MNVSRSLHHGNSCSRRGRRCAWLGVRGPAGILGRAAGALAGYTLDQALFGTRRQGRRAAARRPRRAGLDRGRGRSRASTGARGSPARSSGRRISRRWRRPRRRRQGRAERHARRNTPTSRISPWGFARGRSRASAASGRTARSSTRRASRSASIAATRTQDADSLIVAKEGGEAPAYRGTAYVVFERMPLAEFGNRIPQLSFEVFRPVPGIEEHVRAVCVIPGSTEFGYDTAAGDAERRRGRDARRERACAARRLRLDGVDRRVAGALPEPRMGDAGRRLVRRRSARRRVHDPAEGGRCGRR